MTPILHDIFVAARPESMLLATINMRRELHGFRFVCMHAVLFFSYGAPLGELSGHRNSAIICNVSLISPCVRRINLEVLTRQSELEFCFGGSNSWDMHVPVIICFWIAFYRSGFLHRSSYPRKNHNSPFLINNVKIQPKTLDLSM